MLPGCRLVLHPMKEALTWLKARFQEAQAASLLWKYRRAAQTAGITLREGESLRTALRHRLGNYGISTHSREKGKLHIFLTYGQRSWEEILPRSLQEFGEVTEFEWRSHGFDDLDAGWLGRRGEMNRDMLAAFRTAHARRPIDVVVGYLSGHNTDPQILSEMRRSGAIVFNFCFDDKLHFPGGKLGGRYTSPAAIASEVDLNLTNAPSSRLKYAVHGGLALFWPEAAEPSVHRPQNVPVDFDVSFVGARYGWRPTLIHNLRNRGIRVECFGHRWEHGSLPRAEMVKLYSRSRINLGFGGIGHSHRLMCLKARDFEVPMSGGLYLTQDNPELNLVFKPGEEIVTYSSVSDCAEKIQFLLSHPDTCKSIRSAGRERALRDHSYEARWSHVFRLAGLLN